MTAEYLMRVSNPCQIFPNDLTGANKLYKQLASRWHPDRGGDQNVFVHLSSLYHRVVELISSGKYQVPGELQLSALDGTKYTIRYRNERDFELGKMYISETILFYLIEGEYKDLVKSALEVIGGIKYRDEKMKEEYRRYLPTIFKTFVTTDNKVGVVIGKTHDIYSLRDILNYFSGSLLDRHVAWIMSTLHNICCFLAYNKVAHNDISPDTYFISPAHHSGFLFGGWWYSSVGDQKLLALPVRTMNILSNRMKVKKQSSTKINLELIRLVGLELLGNKKGGKGIPKSLWNWLRFPSTGDAITDYRLWQDVLSESFGPRKFVKMEINEKKIFQY
jgi:hypothetical protein